MVKSYLGAIERQSLAERLAVRATGERYECLQEESLRTAQSSNVCLVVVSPRHDVLLQYSSSLTLLTRSFSRRRPKFPLISNKQNG
jgi:hypothetical protein